MAVPAFKFPRPAKLQLVGGEWRGSMGKCDPGHQLNIGGIGAKTKKKLGLTKKWYKLWASIGKDN